MIVKLNCRRGCDVEIEGSKQDTKIISISRLCALCNESDGICMGGGEIGCSFAC